MDPSRNPFVPGAGTPPPELAGRQEILDQATVVLNRAELGRHAKSMILVGLRGVGKTVLLVRIDQMARERGFHSALVESPDDGPLAALIVPPLRSILLALDRQGALSEAVKRGLRALRGFTNALKVKYEGVEVGIEIEPIPGVADSGSLDQDLADLMVAVGEAAKARKTAVVLLIDEMQYLAEPDFGALIMAIHKTNQRQLPVVLVGAGLPQIVGNAGRAKSYAERLFDYPEIGPLSEAAAKTAVAEPVFKEGEKIERGAVDAIVHRTRRYPYFLQVWGYHAWNEAPNSPIRAKHVADAEADVISNIDKNFFRVRFDRLTPAERRYLRAMAELGPGPHRSGDIAERLGVKVSSVGPVRSSLIRKGMAWSPQHGDTAFTVPMFDEFMKREMPKFDV